MFPKQNFSVKITDERLLDSKRGTLKRSGTKGNYSLQKTDSSILISMAEPLAYKDYALGFLEGKIDMLDKKADEYSVEVSLKKMIKVLYSVFALTILFRMVTLLLGAPIQVDFDVICFVGWPLVFYFQYRQFSKGAEEMVARLRTDRAIFA